MPGLVKALYIVICINSFVMLCLYLFALIQLFGWKKSFENDWNLNIQMQYEQMESSFSLRLHIFASTSFAAWIRDVGLHNLFKIWRRIRWMHILVLFGIIGCFSGLFVLFVCPLKSAEIIVQSIFKVSVLFLNSNVFVLLLYSYRMNIHCRKYQLQSFIWNFCVY